MVWLRFSSCDKVFSIRDEYYRFELYRRYSSALFYKLSRQSFFFMSPLFYDYRCYHLTDIVLFSFHFFCSWFDRAYSSVVCENVAIYSVHDYRVWYFKFHRLLVIDIFCKTFFVVTLRIVWFYCSLYLSQNSIYEFVWFPCKCPLVLFSYSS